MDGVIALMKTPFLSVSRQNVLATERLNRMLRPLYYTVALPTNNAIDGSLGRLSPLWGHAIAAREHMTTRISDASILSAIHSARELSRERWHLPKHGLKLSEHVIPMRAGPVYAVARHAAFERHLSGIDVGGHPPSHGAFGHWIQARIAA